MFTTFLYTTLLTFVLSRVEARNLLLHELLDVIPAGFTLTEPAAPETVLSLRLALVQNDIEGLIEQLLDVSDPTSDCYGQFLTKEEVEEYVAPTEESVEAVYEWLSEYGLNATKLSSAGDWLAINLTVSDANELLSANYSVFTHNTTGLQAVRTLAYSIPEDLKPHLDFVHPTIAFPSGSSKPIVKAKTSSSNTTDANADTTTVSSAACGTGTPAITPACLQYLYDIPTTPATGSGSELAVTGYDGQYAQFADLESFLAEYRTDMNSSTTFEVTLLNGGMDPQNGSVAGIESNLDIQYTVGLATDVPVTFISVEGGFSDALLYTVESLLNMTSPPQVVSTSYGENESDVPSKLANNICNAYAQLGARGVSLLFASGDGGVSGNQDESCTTFVPTFPSTCPYVTSVGATTNLPTEQAASFSGGGFSNYWATPSYQASAVSTFLAALGSNDTGLYNATGRGYPDVAAYGVSYDIYSDAETLEVSGTSCSTPTFASIIALLNDELLAAGKSSLGFLNPWLYSTAADALNDIIVGDNLACETASKGFYAVEGWDPVSGLGTPNYTLLRTAAGL